MVKHLTRGTWPTSDSLILPRAPCDESSLSGTLKGTMHVELMRWHSGRRRRWGEPLKIKNMILHPDDVIWPMSNCIRITAFWSDHTNQRVHNVSISEAAITRVCVRWNHLSNHLSKFKLARHPTVDSAISHLHCVIVPTGHPTLIKNLPIKQALMDL